VLSPSLLDGNGCKFSFELPIRSLKTKTEEIVAVSETINIIWANLSLVKRVPISQVSVFLDNHPGSLSQVMSQLDNSKIRIFAMSIADAGEFGLVRMITEDPERASKLLEDADFNLAKSRKNTEVIAIQITDSNKISLITRILGENGLNIEYAYSSAVHVEGTIALIARVNDVAKAEAILRASNVVTMSLAEIKQFF
jgi:hypothetical protein